MQKFLKFLQAIYHVLPAKANAEMLEILAGECFGQQQNPGLLYEILTKLITEGPR